MALSSATFDQKVNVLEAVKIDKEDKEGVCGDDSATWRVADSESIDSTSADTSPTAATTYDTSPARGRTTTANPRKSRISFARGTRRSASTKPPPLGPSIDEHPLACAQHLSVSASTIMAKDEMALIQKIRAARMVALEAEVEARDNLDQKVWQSTQDSGLKASVESVRLEAQLFDIKCVESGDALSLVLPSVVARLSSATSGSLALAREVAGDAHESDVTLLVPSEVVGDADASAEVEPGVTISSGDEVGTDSLEAYLSCGRGEEVEASGGSSSSTAVAPEDLPCEVESTIAAVVVAAMASASGSGCSSSSPSSASASAADAADAADAVVAADDEYDAPTCRWSEFVAPAAPHATPLRRALHRALRPLSSEGLQPDPPRLRIEYSPKRRNVVDGEQ